MVGAFRSVREGLAASSAPDRRLLLVFDFVVFELRDALEIFATRSTLEQKLLSCGTGDRLGALGFVRFLLLPSPTMVRGVRVFERGRRFLIIDSLVGSVVVDT